MTQYLSRATLKELCLSLYLSLAGLCLCTGVDWPAMPEPKATVASDSGELAADDESALPGERIDRSEPCITQAGVEQREYSGNLTHPARMVPAIRAPPARQADSFA